MTDYRHDLAFGSFLTPTSSQPQQAVTLALLSEQLGLDLVTFQDHPYQPGFLDTSTLLSYVAARTVDIRLAANVTNLPLRPPAVLARSAASLDLLSGGRFELGLGSGAFWDAIEAMGVTRLGPGDAVDALDEAIEIIRQVWDVETRGGLRVDGRHYRVVGAKRGPAPVHRIEIWLGAYKPRMLALTGRRADGWLPSLGYLQPGDLAAGNERIDEAAYAAGRSPSAIRRLLNVSGRFAPAARGPLQGPADQWAEELAGWALSDGISTFILASDHPDDLRRFAEEVAPATRELVDAERATGAPRRPERDSVQVAAPSGTPFAVVPTPDDGRRRSAERAWDESDRPTAPAPHPQRGYTPDEQASGQHLIDVHNGLRAELSQLHDLVEQVGAGQIDAGHARSAINDMTLRQNEWVLGAYCTNYCRLVTMHHTIEDRSVFPGLRRADPALGPVLDRLQQEHVAIHDVIERVDRALVEFVSSDDMATLRAAVDLLDDALLSHLSFEERELVEPLARTGLL